MVFLLCILVLYICFVILVDDVGEHTWYFVLYVVDCLYALLSRIFCFLCTVLHVWSGHCMFLNSLVLCGWWSLGSIFLCLVLVEHRLYHQCLVSVSLWHFCCNALPVATSFSASFVSVVWFVHVAWFELVASTWIIWSLRALLEMVDCVWVVLWCMLIMLSGDPLLLPWLLWDCSWWFAQIVQLDHWIGHWLVKSLYVLCSHEIFELLWCKLSATICYYRSGHSYFCEDLF